VSPSATTTTLTDDQTVRLKELKKLLDEKHRSPEDNKKITELVHDLQEDGFTQALIGKNVGRSGPAIARWSKKYPKRKKRGQSEEDQELDKELAKEIKGKTLLSIKDRVVQEFQDDLLMADHFRTKHAALRQLQGEDFYGFIDKCITFYLLMGEDLEMTIDTLTQLVDETRQRLEIATKDNKHLRRALTNAQAELRVYEAIFNRAFHRGG
jgi:hypothetical protein